MPLTLLQFEDFELDRAACELRRGGKAVRLERIPFDLLIFLLERPGQLVTRKEIQQRIWGEDVFGDIEHGINTAIRKLRLALGDNPEAPRFVVTVRAKGYRFAARVRDGAPTAPATLSSTESIKSIAVLPFQPLVPSDADGSLEMGMADTLIARLSNIRDIVVRPMSSVRKFADLHQDALLAGRDLGVESVLEGSLQRHGNKIRVTVRLLSVSDGRSLWAGTFDEDLTDIFALQDTIAQRVVRALALEISPEDKVFLNKRFTESTKAYQFYLKGRYYWWKSSPEEYSKSRDYFHRAVEEDPAYALGYCGLNSFYGYGAAWGLLPPDEGWPKAEWAITKALDLDDSLAEAHLGMAALKMVYYRDWVGAEKEAKRAIEITPKFDEIHYAYSFYLVVMRRFDEAVTEGKRALACDPFSLRINQHLGNTFYYARRYVEAIRQYQQTIELYPSDASLHESLSNAYEQNGQYREAAGASKTAMGLSGDPELAAKVGAADGKAGFRAAMRAVAAKRLDQLNETISKGGYVPAINFARAYLRTEDTEQALRCLKLSSEERNVYSLIIGSDPLYDPVRMDRRFIKLLQRMKLDR